MSKEDRIAEINIGLRKNEEKTDAYKRCLSELQREEELFDYEAKRRKEDLDRLSDVVGGITLNRIQSEAFFYLDQMNQKVRLSLQNEHDQINRNLQNLSREKEDLLYNKRMLDKEVK